LGLDQMGNVPLKVVTSGVVYVSQRNVSTRSSFHSNRNKDKLSRALYCIKYNPEYIIKRCVNNLVSIILAIIK